jgi:hypothetical protein
MLKYAVKLFVIHFPNEECYGIYAMDVSDAWETLARKEPHVKVKNINLIEEHQCSDKLDTLH